VSCACCPNAAGCAGWACETRCGAGSHHKHMLPSPEASTPPLLCLAQPYTTSCCKSHRQRTNKPALYTLGCTSTKQTSPDGFQLHPAMPNLPHAALTATKSEGLCLAGCRSLPRQSGALDVVFQPLGRLQLCTMRCGSQAQTMRHSAQGSMTTAINCRDGKCEQLGRAQL
jgi:hypothetical protein